MFSVLGIVTQSLKKTKSLLSALPADLISPFLNGVFLNPKQLAALKNAGTNLFVVNLKYLVIVNFAASFSFFHNLELSTLRKNTARYFAVIKINREAPMTVNLKTEKVGIGRMPFLNFRTLALSATKQKSAWMYII